MLHLFSSFFSFNIFIVISMFNFKLNKYTNIKWLLLRTSTSILLYWDHFYCFNNNDNRQRSADSQKSHSNGLINSIWNQLFGAFRFFFWKTLHISFVSIVFVLIQCWVYAIIFCALCIFMVHRFDLAKLGCDLYDVNVKLIRFGLGFIMIWLLLLVILVGNYQMGRVHEFIWNVVTWTKEKFL